MNLKLKEINEILQKEIDWCSNNPDNNLSGEFQEGFIGGLMQAQYLIEKAEKVLADQKFYFGLSLEKQPLERIKKNE